jgi:hypothetical protein
MVPPGQSAAIIANAKFGRWHSGEFQNDTAAAAYAGRISRARPQFGRSRRAPFLTFIFQIASAR